MTAGYPGRGRSSSSVPWPRWDGRYGGSLSDHHNSSEQGGSSGFRSLRRAWALVDAVPVAVFEWIDDGQTLVWNRAAERVFGWPATEVIGKPCPVFANPAGDFPQALRDQALSGVPIDGEHVTVTRADGTTVEVSMSSAVVVCEDATSVVATAVDLTDHVNASRRLRHLATHDALTDLGNRRAFEHALARIVERVRRGGHQGALLLVDVDLLKRVNDELGHLAGDALLIGVADALRMATRPRDVVARIGGDEFAVVLEDVGTRQISLIAERVREAIAALRVGPDAAAHSTASIGAMVVDGALDVLELMAAADDALYVAKRRRDSVELYLQPKAAVSSADDVNLNVTRLRRALSINAIGVQYQGVHSVEDGEVYCEEALARISSDHVSSPAAEFVSVAAGAGLIGEIDRRVANLVLDRLDEHWPGRLSLNLSAASLTATDPLASLRKRAPDGGYNERLILEARESDLLADPRRAARWAESVRELGAMVAIDDFSASSAALAAIKTLPTDVVKIDGSVISSLAAEGHPARVDELVSACRDQGVVLVAKRIQDAATLDLLPRIGITLAQGFLIDAPHPVVGLIDVLETAEEFGTVSAGLVAWEFMVPEPAVGLVWRRALNEQLLAPHDTDPETGEAMCALTANGKVRLRELRAHRH